MAGSTASAARLMLSKSTMSCLPQWEDGGRELITTIGLDEIDRKLRVFLEGASQIRAGLNLGQKMKEWSRAVRMKALSQIFQARFRLRNIGLWGYLGAAIPARKSMLEPRPARRGFVVLGGHSRPLPVRGGLLWRADLAKRPLVQGFARIKD
jgi:hypothetical protein